MKYETEINEFIDIAFPKESWMDEEEHHEVISETFKVMGLTKEKLSEQIDIGVKNGYSVQQQIEIIKKVLNVA